ncbi:MAG: hypothetical protein GOMPHAMPRED_002991 [Gomphillus americanus]|uniref:Rhodopsin domain-containing protein n=1 Tax=Gomphillus americanus TaxID=1940652 RepID=A0A8H3EGQ7_9LECA|nr:MAG: hypothetical protein GOMPHAMPRED_002991 [Gomphillus americanus]
MFYYQNTIAIVNIVFPVLAALAVLARLSARRLTKLSLQADDWLIIVAWVVIFSDGILSAVAVYNWDYGDLLTKPRSQTVFKYLYVDGIFISFTIGIIKCSVVMFYKRIFTTRTFNKWANVVLAVSIAWTIASTLTKMFETTPDISKYWTDHGYTTINTPPLLITLNVTDLVLDLIILSLPLPVIRSLHISKKKRLAVLAIFGLGFFCVVSTCVRLYYFILVPPTKDPAYIVAFPEDATVAVDASIMWVHIECSASIITACLPTLVPFFTKMKTITTSIGSGWTRFTRSKASTTGRSENSLDLKSFDLSKRNSSTELEADKPNPQIHATTVISVV